MQSLGASCEVSAVPHKLFISLSSRSDFSRRGDVLGGFLSWVEPPSQRTTENPVRDWVSKSRSDETSGVMFAFRCWRRCRRRLDVAVHQVLKFFAWLEKRVFFGGNLYPISGFGIPSYARLSLPGSETAKPAYLNLVAGAQRPHYTLEDRFYNDFAVLAG